MIEPNPQFCAACGCEQQFDGMWRSVWIDEDRNLTVSRPWRRPPVATNEHALACGQGAVMVLVERFLDRGTFAPLPVLALEQELQEGAFLCRTI